MGIILEGDYDTLLLSEHWEAHAQSWHCEDLSVFSADGKKGKGQANDQWLSYDRWSESFLPRDGTPITVGH
jgi:hypothetical protein